MAKSKFAPALFEVIDRTEEKKKQTRLAVPKWWKNEPAQEDGKPLADQDDLPPAGNLDGEEPTEEAAVDQIETAPPESEPPAPVASRPEPPRPTPQPRPKPKAIKPPARPKRAPKPPNPAGGTGAKPPLAEVEQGRLKLSMNPTNACVAAGILLLALFTSYQLGAHIAQPGDEETTAGQDDGISDEQLASALQAPPDSNVLDSGPKTLMGSSSTPTKSLANQPISTVTGEGSASSGSSANGPARTPGLNYVVIERFKSHHLDDAVHAQEFFTRRGMPATVEKDGGYYQLVSTKGFEYTRQAENEWLSRARSVGRAYLQEFKDDRVIRYSFRSPYVKKWSGR